MRYLCQGDNPAENPYAVRSAAGPLGHSRARGFPVCEPCCRACKGELAETLALHRARPVIELRDERGVDCGNVSVNHDVILGEIVVHEITVALVDDGLLGQRGADTERHAADRLGASGLGVEDSPRPEHAQHPAQTDLARHAVHANFSEVGAKGMLTKILSRIAGISSAVGLEVRRSQ
jgi:hypothetical protein